MTKKVLITGGSRGIGRSLVHTFHAAGYEVVFTYRSGEAEARNIVSHLSYESSHSIPPECIYLDLADYTSLKTCADKHNDTDILILNAGLGSKTVENVADTDYEQDRLLLQTNALGSLTLCKLCLPVMEKRGSGKIVLISSVGGGINTFPSFRVAEQMSKAALKYLGQQLSAQYINSGIDTFTVCPGATDTEMFQRSTLNTLSQKQRDHFVNSLPGERLISPDEIAQLCFYLCQPEAQLLRGSILDASLGLGSWPAALKKEQV